MSSPDADLQRHELKAEAEAEWTLEEKIRPKRPGPVAPRRPVDGGCGFPWISMGAGKAIFEGGIGYG